MSSKEVHIYYANVSQLNLQYKQLYGFLSDDEIQKAEGLHFETDRRKAVLCRGYLRKLLGEYCGILPEEIQFKYEKNGKPFIANDNSASFPEFNLSHSKDMVLIGFAEGGKVGVDVEFMKDDIEYEEIARRFFFGL